MPGIKCPDCNKKISDKSTRCKYCGCKIAITDYDIFNRIIKGIKVVIGIPVAMLYVAILVALVILFVKQLFVSGTGRSSVPDNCEVFGTAPYTETVCY